MLSHFINYDGSPSFVVRNVYAYVCVLFMSKALHNSIKVVLPGTKYFLVSEGIKED